MGFSRQKYWSGFPFPSPKNLPDLGIEPTSPALAGTFFTIEPTGKPQYSSTVFAFIYSLSCVWLFYDPLNCSLPGSCFLVLPRGRSGKESVCQCRRCKRCRVNPWARKILWGRKWQPAPVFWLGKFHGQSSLAGDSPWGYRESHTTGHVLAHTHTHTHTHTIF